MYIWPIFGSHLYPYSPFESSARGPKVLPSIWQRQFIGRIGHPKRGLLLHHCSTDITWGFFCSSTAGRHFGAGQHPGIIGGNGIPHFCSPKLLFVFVGVFFIFYHGKSPLNHHLGDYVLLFPRILSSKSKKNSTQKWCVKKPSKRFELVIFPGKGPSLPILSQEIYKAYSNW